MSSRHPSSLRPSSTDGVFSAASLPKWLWAVALLSLAWRLWLSALLPMTGDEALFYWWARFLDYGYYDHPPMVAWWIAGARALLGDATWAVRLPGTLLPLGVGAAMWWGWSGQHRERTAWAILFYWLMPVNWLNAFITTDTPLIFWAAWSTAAMARAEQKAQTQAQAGQGAWGLYALSGVCMGAAFLSKYFAVLLGVAFAVYFAWAARPRWRGFVLMTVCALPAVALNVLWNLTHCWTNIMFNVFNRNDDAVFTLDKPLSYVAMMAYLLGPVLIWQAIKHRHDMGRVLREHRLLSCAAIVPLLIFGLMAGKKVIGLHWVLGFYPFVFLLFAWLLPTERLPAARRASLWFLLPHLVLVLALSMGHLSQWQGFRYYHRLVEALRAEQIVQKLQAPGTVLMGQVYSATSIYGYAAGQHVPVFGLGSVHARQDDLIVDYARFEGQTLRILRSSKPELSEYAPFFDRVSLLEAVQDGQPFYAVEGVNFHYAPYREQVMGEVNRRYYHFPSWLPVWGCAFCQHYCNGVRCTP